MLPQVPIIRVTDSEKIPLPSYYDGVGTCVTLRSNEVKSIKIAPQHFETFSTGFAIALPMGMEAQVRSLKESTESGVIVLNAPATIDASDRKEIKVCIFNASQESVIIKQGDPIALMVFSMALRIRWVDLAQQPGNTSYLNTQPREEPTPTVSNTSEAVSIEVATSDNQDIIQPVTRSKTEKNLISEEDTPDEDPVATPSILEEFEKIESEFEDDQSEDDN